jgi:putative membrane protein
MDFDLLLAIAHHLAVFTLVAIFAAEFALLRAPLAGPRIKLLSQVDAAYGGVAGLVIVVGIVRVIFGASGWDYYVFNLAFWAKMGAFLVMGLLTMPPTFAIRRWLRDGKDDPAHVVPTAEIAHNQRYLYLQAAALLLVPTFAAMMARGYGAI